MLAPTWSEEGTGAHVTIRFNGKNADVVEDLEVAQFSVGVKTPAEEDKGGAAFVSARRQGRVMTPTRAASYVLGFAVASLGYLLAEALDLRGGARIALVIVAWIIGSISVPLVLLVRRNPSAPTPVRSPEESFTLTFRPGAFELSGSQGTTLSVPLADIRAFENRMKRIELVRRDGTRTRLPCLLLGGRPEELAARLTALALAQGSAYRGAQ